MQKLILLFLINLNLINSTFSMDFFRSLLAENSDKTRKETNLTLKEFIRDDTKNVLEQINKLPKELIEKIKEEIINKHFFILIDLFKNSKKIDNHSSKRTPIAFSSDNRFAITSNSKNGIRLWDLCASNNNPKYFDFGDSIRSFALSADNKTAFAGYWNGQSSVWDLSNLNDIVDLGAWRAHGASVNSVAISPKGRLAISGGEDGAARLWNLELIKDRKFNLLKEVQTESWIKSSCFSKDGNIALIRTDDVEVIVWDLHDINNIKEFKLPNTMRAAALSPDGKYVLSLSKTKILQIWNLSNFDSISSEVIKEETLSSVKSRVKIKFSNDGKFALIVEPGLLLILNLTDAANITKTVLINHESENIADASFSDNNKFIASVSNHFGADQQMESSLSLWDITDFVNITQRQLFKEKLYSEFLAFNYDKKIILTEANYGAYSFNLIPNLSIEQLALVSKILNLTKNGIKWEFLLEDKLYLDIFNQFSPEQRENIINKFNQYLDRIKDNSSILTQIKDIETNNCEIM